MAALNKDNATALRLKPVVTQVISALQIAKSSRDHNELWESRAMAKHLCAQRDAKRAARGLNILATLLAVADSLRRPRGICAYYNNDRITGKAASLPTVQQKRAHKVALPNAAWLRCSAKVSTHRVFNRVFIP